MGVAAVGGVMVSLARGPATPAPLRAETAIAAPVVAQKWTVAEALPAIEASYTAPMRADTVATVDSVTVSAATVALPPVINVPTAAKPKLSLVAKAWTNVHSRCSARRIARGGTDARRHGDRRLAGQRVVSGGAV